MCIPTHFTHCNFRQQIVELNTFSGKSWDRKSEYGLFKEKMLYKKRVFHTNHRLSWNLENLSLFNSGNRKYSTLQSKRINTNKLPMILTAMADLRSGWIHLKFAIIGMQRKRNFRFPGIFLVMWTSYMTIRCCDFAIVAHKQLQYFIVG